MKVLSIVIFYMFFTGLAFKAYAQSTTNISEIGFSIDTNLLLNQDYYDKKGNKGISVKLEKISTIFSQMNESSVNIKPSPEYIAAFKGYDMEINSLKSLPDSTALKLLNDIQEDMEVKLKRYNSMNLDDKFTRPVRVKIVTRKIVDGKEQDIPGYTIKYKLWFLKDEKTPLFNFTNPTLSAEKSITPGNYDIWAELPDSSKQYPQNRTRRRIPDVDGNDVVIIVLLVK